jgi:hypothetical protein
MGKFGGIMHFRTTIFIFLSVAFSTVFPVMAQEKMAEKEKNFIVFSIPKCGSGLINKFFQLTSSKKRLGPSIWFTQLITKKCPTNSFSVTKYLSPENVELIITHVKKNKGYLFSHTNFSKPFINFINNHNDWKCVLQIRDLRDACLSMVHWQNDLIQEAIGNQASFDDKLLFVISGAGSVYKNQVFNLQKCALRALEIMDHPNVIVSRFEDLVGSKGGGDDGKQRELIYKLADELNLGLKPHELEEVASILWGNEEGPFKPTFRQGQIHKWKEIYKPQHIYACKKYFGEILIKLGYEVDLNW